MTSIRTFATIMTLGLAFQAASAADVNNIKPLNSIAFEVNGSIITYRDIERLTKELSGRNKDIPQEQLVQAAKTRLLERALLADAAKQQGLKVPQEMIDVELARRAKAENTTIAALYEQAAANGYRRSAYRLEVAKDLLIEHMMSNLNSEVKITQNQIDDALKSGQNLPAGEPYTVYTIRRIILHADSQENMDGIGQRLQQIANAIAHGSDFAAMAKRYSQEPQAANGGLHDDITDMMLPENVEELLHQLQPTQATVPLRAGNTWQIVQFLEKRTETNPEKMQREAVRRMLVRQAQQENQAQFLEQLQQSAVLREY
ncbi:peptidylprolyl isomerase [Wielerella bovis]|uniref:peptidylprolyl isomerase n=1 Tax=Wielerella bovis TaxID=2917790 RepID=UPI002019DAB9|nr:peptidylprolyl isomerase [Wielerella bovis]MCG7656459.1 peptidylprolyl isomerase [Wielerella bovis]MCG7658684.1 peptidylprolyl isomerase [Wielerella bovis]